MHDPLEQFLMPHLYSKGKWNDYFLAIPDIMVGFDLGEYGKYPLNLVLKESFLLPKKDELFISYHLQDVISGASVMCQSYSDICDRGSLKNRAEIRHGSIVSLIGAIVPEEEKRDFHKELTKKKDKDIKMKQNSEQRILSAIADAGDRASRRFWL